MKGQIIYEGVTFITAPCAKMSKAEFVKAHTGHFWTDRDEATQKKMLGEAYDRIVPPKKEKSE